MVMWRDGGVAGRGFSTPKVPWPPGTGDARDRHASLRQHALNAVGPLWKPGKKVASLRKLRTGSGLAYLRSLAGKAAQSWWNSASL